MTWGGSGRALQSAEDTCTTELLRIAIAGLTNVALDQVTTAQNGLNSVDVGITANATHANWVVAYLNSAAFLPDLTAFLATSSCADLGDYTSSTPTATQAVATISPPPPNPSPPPSCRSKPQTPLSNLFSKQIGILSLQPRAALSSLRPSAQPCYRNSSVRGPTGQSRRRQLGCRETQDTHFLFRRRRLLARRLD